MIENFDVEVIHRTSKYKKNIFFLFQSDRMEYEQTAYIAQCRIQCPKGCTCDGTTVICRGLQLTEIPSDIPAFTTSL
jgi:hypothetical protein